MKPENSKNWIQFASEQNVTSMTKNILLLSSNEKQLTQKD